MLEKRHLDREAGLRGLPGGHGVRCDRLKEAGSRVVSNPQSWFPNPHTLRKNEGILEQSPAPITLCLSKMASSLSHPASPPEPRSNLFPTLPTTLLQASTEGLEVSEVSGCLGARVHLFVGPELLVLLSAKALIIVAFALKQLLKMGFAVKFPVQCRVAAQAAEAEQLWLGWVGAGR